MPANHQKPATQTPASPRNTAKYTNKDGSKFITVPKGANLESSQPSTPTSGQPSTEATDTTTQMEPAPTVNRKKQKRREKAAAKAAAEQAVNGHPSPASQTAKTQQSSLTERYEVNSEDEDYEYVLTSELTNGHAPSESKAKKSSPSCMARRPKVTAL